MAFDLSTAKPIQGGFDITTARPVDESTDLPVGDLTFAPGDALLSIGSGALAEPLSGLAGLAGFVGGMVPGGETPGEKGKRFVEATREAITFQPRTQAATGLVESVGRLAELGTKAVRVPVAGIAGLLQLPFGGVSGAVETAERIMEEGIGPTAGEAVMETTGSPFLAAATETIPVAAATLLGARGPRPRPKEPVVPPPKELAVPPPKGPVVPREPAVPPRPTEPAVPPKPEVSAQKIVEDLRKGKTAKVAEAVVPDVKVVEAAQRLGIDLNPEHYATSSAFQDVARALKSKPGSELLAGEVQALRQLSTKADELVTDIGGSIDKAAVSDDILNSTRSTIDQLEKRANVAYGKVREAIKPQARVKTTNISEFIKERLADLGGDKSLLSGIERQLQNLIKGGEDGTITYAALDRVRRDVGEGFNRTGPFADDSQRVLREVYDVLSDTQQGAAEAFGVGEVYAAARGLVTKRKRIEDQAVVLFGKNLANSLVPQIRAAATKLPKGDVTSFNKLMQALPEARRGEVAATVLGELFAAGSRQGGQLGTGFATTWRNLNRNKAAKDTLMRHLPPGTRRRFQDIGQVMSAIVRSNAKSLANPSGSAGPIIAALEKGTLATSLYRGAAAETVGTLASGVPGLATVLRSGINKPQVSRVSAADELLTSQTFKDAIGEAVQGNTARANQIMENSPRFKKWAKTLTQAEAAQLARVGFIGYVSGQSADEG